jgi:hypothetical protein
VDRESSDSAPDGIQRCRLAGAARAEEVEDHAERLDGSQARNHSGATSV